MLTMTIPRRFCGPPNSGNGGYVCGTLARCIPGAAEVTLRAPPPWPIQYARAVAQTNTSKTVVTRRLVYLTHVRSACSLPMIGVFRSMAARWLDEDGVTRP